VEQSAVAVSSRFPIIVTALVIWGALGCGAPRGATGTAAPVPAGESGSGVHARDVATDAQIAARVRGALAPYRAIVVTVDGGIVSLRGHVATLARRERAVRLASEVDGVRAVSSQLELRHRARTDFAVARDLQRVLGSDPGGVGDHIDVEVQSGLVVLRGTVSNQAERELMARSAKSVPGVLELDDLVVVVRDRPREEARL
jgi:osmotically-inducible protein OsmY